MACTSNRQRFWRTIPASALPQSAGGGAALVERLWQTMHSKAERTPATDADDRAARDDTALLFQKMQATGLRLPAHTDPDPRYGIPLPAKRAALHAYAEVYRFLYRGARTPLVDDVMRAEGAQWPEPDLDVAALPRLKQGYRVGRWSAPRSATAADVVAYEEDAVGSATGCVVPRHVLATLPGQALRWVTKTKGAARRYGSAVETIAWEDGVIISTGDGDGGYLVVERRVLEHALQASAGVKTIDASARH